MARDDINAILSQVFPFAQQCLQKNGEFYPFAVRMNANDEIIAIAASEGAEDEEDPSAQEVIDMLTEMLHEAAKEDPAPKAVAICFEATVSHDDNPEPHAAICVQIEDADGEALLVSLPYTRDEKGVVSCGDVAASPVDRQFYAQP